MCYADYKSQFSTGVLSWRHSLALRMFYSTFLASPQEAQGTSPGWGLRSQTRLGGERGWRAASADGIKRKMKSKVTKELVQAELSNSLCLGNRQSGDNNQKMF